MTLRLSAKPARGHCSTCGSLEELDKVVFVTELCNCVRNVVDDNYNNVRGSRERAAPLQFAFAAGKRRNGETMHRRLLPSSTEVSSKETPDRSRFASSNQMKVGLGGDDRGGGEDSEDGDDTDDRESDDVDGKYQHMTNAATIFWTFSSFNLKRDAATGGERASAPPTMSRRERVSVAAGVSICSNCRRVR